jgi:hypothetical protein
MLIGLDFEFVGMECLLTAILSIVGIQGYRPSMQGSLVNSSQASFFSFFMSDQALSAPTKSLQVPMNVEETQNVD